MAPASSASTTRSRSDERRQHHHLTPGACCDDPAGGLDAVDARHRQIHQHHVGTLRPGTASRPPRRRRRCPPLQLTVGSEQCHQPVSHDRVIVDDTDPDHGPGSSSSTRVPLPGCELTAGCRRRTRPGRGDRQPHVALGAPVGQLLLVEAAAVVCHRACTVPLAWPTLTLTCSAPACAAGVSQRLLGGAEYQLFGLGRQRRGPVCTSDARRRSTGGQRGRQVGQGRRQAAGRAARAGRSSISNDRSCRIASSGAGGALGRAPVAAPARVGPVPCAAAIWKEWPASSWTTPS